jgi:two-component system sensor histidine kinase/response regulator
VLLVDDDEEDYMIARDLLSEVGIGVRFRLDWVGTYGEGLAAMQRAEHDAYVLDYRLGERDGLELMREARKGGCAAPMILLTGQGDREVDLQAMEAGATDYLVKGEINAPLLERSVRYAIERARVERLRQSLVALASEELRAPMVVVKDRAISLLLQDQGELSEHAVDVIGGIIQAADHCARLLDGFVDLSRIEVSRAVRAEPGLFDVRGMVEEALEIVRLAGHGCTFDEHVPEEVGQVRGDRYELLLVLADLLANAAAHSPEAGIVRVTVTAEDGRVGFAVADEGPGIPEGMVDDLFTPFYLMKDEGKRGVRGTGLGLCHSKQIVEAHGGRIWVESAPGKGTTVRFEIPA